MIELLPHILRAMFARTFQPTKTETFTQNSMSAPAFKSWRESQLSKIQSNTTSFLSRPHEQRVVNLGPPISKDPIQTGQNYKPPQGITGGPPMTTTKTTVTFRK